MRLVSHALCPYVQRAAIVAAEKAVAIERIFIDLAAKPDWFLALSPTGKVPVLIVEDPRRGACALFESAAIAEFLDEIKAPALLPDDPIDRARTRAFVEFASGTLADIAGLYGAEERRGFEAKRAALQDRFARLEAAIAGPWFAGVRFGLVDAAFAPVFRYLDAFERMLDLSLAADLASVAAWRRALAARPSVIDAAVADYPERLETFLRARRSYLGDRLGQDALADP